MKPTTYVWLAICILATSTHAQDFDYLPAPVGDHQVLTYTQYTLSYNEHHEQAEWVAYELTAAEAVMTTKRCDCFASDKRVTTGSAAARDYSSTGFDKGHLCPAADNNLSPKANRESFLLSNISPQLPIFNRQHWKALESWVRYQAMKYERIYVVTGPVFVNNLGTLPESNVTIPGYYYKAVLRFDGNKVKTIAFLMPQVGCTGNLGDYVVSVNTLETLTGLDFYPALDRKENSYESQVQPLSWGWGLD